MNIIFSIMSWISMLMFWTIGLSIMVSSFENLRIGYQSRKWVVTQALVNNHRVNSYNTGTRDNEIRRYSYIVIYTYVVDGIKYTSEGVGEGRFAKGGFATAAEAEAATSQLYPVGQVLNVFYNPKKHDESVSSKGLGWNSWNLLAVLIGFGVFSFSTGVLLEFILSVFGLDGKNLLKLMTNFFVVLPITILLALCYFGLEIIWSAISDIRRKPIASTLTQFAIGCLFLVISINFMVQIISEPLGLLVIGSKPDSGCYRPDFGQKKWLPISCPPPRNRDAGL
ncbi:DUF3592 domain-containing protein [Nostoc sp. 'Peltigera membranacea cyanobiont' 232]|uniref:DUF3592 domain-containing protein n=1 Tax=Nostoc sp. 'Peltigera membranacea cyanobiont' 232 TaxID=2014531 RepID=UPI000B9593CD|nr:DUF3592 domain-containing protein [Nostoc sp. 'Peltigera membranacea cyanobiont' 232]OYE00386.1 hypothetical protein CDG79_35380 [Nostoc sp. 'Peltigera membranacea cyanobiont' 232]